MITSPTVTLSFSEGISPDIAYLFCNDKAQLPIHVFVYADGGTVEKIGLCTAFEHAESMTAKDVSSKSLDDLLCAKPVSDTNSRKFEAFPDNEGQTVEHKGFYDAAQTFLLSSNNLAGLTMGRDRKICLGAYAKIKGYIPGPGAAPETVYIYSFMKARNSVGSRVLGNIRVALSLQYKPELRLMVLNKKLDEWGVQGANFKDGAVYQVKPSYGYFAGLYQPRLKWMKTAFYKENKESGELVEIVKPSGDDKQEMHTIYYDKPKGHKNLVTRAVFHGAVQSGQVTHCEDSAAQYMFKRGTGIISCSWYVLQGENGCSKRETDLADEEIACGMFRTTVSDVYGSEASLGVKFKTVASEEHPVSFEFDSRVDFV